MYLQELSNVNWCSIRTYAKCQIVLTCAYTYIDHCWLFPDSCWEEDRLLCGGGPVWLACWHCAPQVLHQEMPRTTPLLEWGLLHLQEGTYVGCVGSIRIMKTLFSCIFMIACDTPLKERDLDAFCSVPQHCTIRRNSLRDLYTWGSCQILLAASTWLITALLSDRFCSRRWHCCV